MAVPSEVAEPATAATVAAEPVGEAQGGPALPIWLIAVIAALAAGGAWVWWRGRAVGQADEQAQWSEPVPTTAEPVPAPVRSPAQSLVPVPPPTPEPTVAPSPAAAPAVTLQLEAHHLSRSLVYVTLAYRLTLDNVGAAPAGPLSIAGDLVSAHASQSRAAQLDPADGALEPRHTVLHLAAGESASLTGEMRIPVSAILPIQQGAAQLFVPLARFRVSDDTGTLATRVFVVGQPSEQPGGALRPFRIDAMPGVFRDLAQREIA